MGFSSIFGNLGNIIGRFSNQAVGNAIKGKEPIYKPQQSISTQVGEAIGSSVGNFGGDSVWTSTIQQAPQQPEIAMPELPSESYAQQYQQQTITPFSYYAKSSPQETQAQREQAMQDAKSLYDSVGEALTKQRDEPRMEGLGHRGRDGEPVENVELSPQFATRGQNYDPSESSIAALDRGGSMLSDEIGQIENMPTKDTNAQYRDYFSKQGYSGSEPLQSERAKSRFIEAAGDAAMLAQIDVPLAPQNRDLVNRYKDKAMEDTDAALTNARISSVDDGRLDERNLTSSYMTGDQYINYASNGFGGRDPETIDPNAIYNKRFEMMEHGFVPYIPSDEVYNQLILDNALDAPTRAGGALRNSRGNMFDYTINFNGVPVKGREREEMNDIALKYDPYIKEIYKSLETTGEIPQNMLTDKNADHSGQSGYRIADVATLPLDDGSVVDIDLTNSTNNFDSISYDGETGIFFDPATNTQSPAQIYLPNGDVYSFDTIEDLNHLADSERTEVVPALDEEAQWWAPVYETENGDTFTYDKMVNFLNNDGDIDYDFSGDVLGMRIPTIAKPAGINPIFDDKGKFHPENVPGSFLPATYDLFASSAPYFFLPTSIPYGLSNAHMASVTADPMSMRNGVAKPLSADLTNNQYATNTIANAAMPLTELGFGRIGSKAFRDPFNTTGVLARKFGKRSWMPAAQWGLGSIGEGVEEIGGNAVEEATRQGLDTWYGDELTKPADINGDGVYDWWEKVPITDPNTGVALKDPNTPVLNRIKNFTRDIPEAFVGGFGMGSIVGVPEIPSTISETRNLMDLNNTDRYAGYTGPVRYAYDRKAEVPELDEEMMEYFRR